MTSVVTASASTAQSPEWDRWFDETFTDLVAADEDLLRAEFDDLIDACRQSPAPRPAAAGGPAPGPGAAEDPPPAGKAPPRTGPDRPSRPPP
jgi:hypothetical protein